MFLDLPLDPDLLLWVMPHTFRQVSLEQVPDFLNNLAIKPTNADENITSLAQVQVANAIREADKAQSDLSQPRYWK